MANTIDKGKETTTSSIRKKLLYGAATLLVIGFAFLLRQGDEQVRAARERVVSDDNSRVIDTECGPINYATDGPADGPPVLSIHGAGGGYDQGLLLAKPLAERGFHVISPSRFGYLRTPVPEKVSPSIQADAYACLLDALDMHEKVSVFGVSAGATSSIQFAIDHPDRTQALVLQSPAATLAPGASIRLSIDILLLIGLAFRNDYAFWFVSKYLKGLLIPTIGATPLRAYYSANSTERKYAEEVMDTILPPSKRMDGISSEQSKEMMEPLQKLESITVPTLIISFKNDKYGTFEIARTLANTIPNSRFVPFEDGGHLAIGHHEVIYEETSNFLWEHIRDSVIYDPELDEYIDISIE